LTKHQEIFVPVHFAAVNAQPDHGNMVVSQYTLIHIFPL